MNDRSAGQPDSLTRLALILVRDAIPLHGNLALHLAGPIFMNFPNPPALA